MQWPADHPGARPTFRPPPPAVRLEAGVVHVWRLPLAVSGPQLQALRRVLSQEEADRADRFHFEADRDRFVVARVGLRSVLSVYTGVAPHQVALSYGSHGKPRISETASARKLEFNLSHSCDWALVAVTQGQAVGVDIERVRAIADMESIARSIFTPPECDALSHAEPSAKASVFFRLWTRKEAVVKAMGSGLAAPLDRLVIEPAAPSCGSTFLLLQDPDTGCRWTGWVFAAADGYEAAVAAEGPAPKALYWQWSPLTD
jgi:4'-phosphopantetheinyl transferase